MINAITAGNCCFVKPSEMCPETSNVMKKLVDKYLDNEAFAVVNGGMQLAKKMNCQKFDLICFTGSTFVGKLVATEAGKNLVPCILELGGKCPFIVDRDADINCAAFKCMSLKTSNSGQVCISPDYAFVHESKLTEFVETCQQKLKQFFGDDPDKLSDFQGKMINKFHTSRVKRLIETSGGKIVCGGKVNVDERHVQPTLILEPNRDAPIMQEEIFACVLPIFAFKDITEVVEFINSKDKPLTIYYFGELSNPNMTYVQQNTSSGHFMANEVTLQVVSHYQGFGGVGASGYGRYGGYEGFKSFSNRKGMMFKKASQPAFLLNLLAPPYTHIDRLLGVARNLGNQTQASMCKLLLSIIVVAISLPFLIPYLKSINAGPASDL